MKFLLSVLLLNSLICGCATYQSKLKDYKAHLRARQFELAAEDVKERAFKEGDDQVVFLFEYGVARQLAGQFEESNKAFLLAEELTDIKDYHSLSRITGSFLLNEGMVQYKGEDYEKVLINAMLAINFLMLNQPESAMVEVRKLNDKLHRYRFEAKRDYEQNPFAFYLSALIREDQKDWDGAYIDYEKAYQLNPQLEFLKQDLIRSAHRARRMEAKKKWLETFKVEEDNSWRDRSQGEVVLIFQQGWGPIKRPHPSWARIPKLYPRPSQTVAVELSIASKASDRSLVVSSVQDVAIKTLEDQYASLIAKRVAGVAAKAVVADQIRQKNQLLGDLAWIGMNLADQADLRQWSSLPQTFQIARLRVPAGTYEVFIKGLNQLDRATGEEKLFTDIKVEKGKKTFLHFRSLL